MLGMKSSQLQCTRLHSIGGLTKCQAELQYITVSGILDVQHAVCVVFERRSTDIVLKQYEASRYRWLT